LKPERGYSTYSTSTGTLLRYELQLSFRKAVIVLDIQHVLSTKRMPNTYELVAQSEGADKSPSSSPCPSDVVIAEAEALPQQQEHSFARLSEGLTCEDDEDLEMLRRLKAYQP
jgi:hypothetical protein